MMDEMQLIDILANAVKRGVIAGMEQIEEERRKKQKREKRINYLDIVGVRASHRIREQQQRTMASLAERECKKFKRRKYTKDGGSWPCYWTRCKNEKRSKWDYCKYVERGVCPFAVIENNQDWVKILSLHDDFMAACKIEDTEAILGKIKEWENAH